MPLTVVNTVADSERQQTDIEFIEVVNDRLFTTDGNLVKIWKTEDLHLVGELDAQQNGISCFASHGNRLYAGTAGGNIIVFDIEKGSVIKELNQHEGSVLVLRVLHGHLYSGDTEGKVYVWQNDQFTNQYETCEEVWDMIPTDDHLYSTRDRDLCVQRIVRTDRGSKLQVVKTVEGRGPLCRLHGKIFMLSRDARDIRIIEDDGVNFRPIGTIKGQDRMINSMVCSARGHRLYSGGYDCAVTSYDINAFTSLSRLDLGQTVVNCIRAEPAGGSGHIFVAGNNGFLCKILDS